eukprot:gene2841-3134_t
MKLGLPITAATGIIAQQDESRFIIVKAATDGGAGVSHPTRQVSLLRRLLGTRAGQDNNGPGTAGGSHSDNGYHWGGGKGWRWPRPQPIDDPAPTRPWPETFVKVKPMAAGREGHRRRQLLGSQHNGGSDSGGSDSQGGDERQGNSWGGGNGWPDRPHSVPKPLPTPIVPPENYPEDPPPHPAGGKGGPRPLPGDRPPIYIALEDKPAANGHRLLLGAGHNSDGNGAGRDSGRGSGSSDGDDGGTGAAGGKYWGGGGKGFPRHFPKDPPFHPTPKDPPGGWGGKHPKPIPIEHGPGGPGPKPIPIEDGPGGPPDMHHMG